MEKDVESRYKFPTDRDLSKEEIGHVYGEIERKDWSIYGEAGGEHILTISAHKPIYIGDIILIWDYKEGRYVAAKIVGQTPPELDTDNYKNYSKDGQYTEKTAELIKTGHTDSLEYPSLYDADAFAVISQDGTRVEPLTFTPHPRASVVYPKFEEVCVSLGIPKKGIPLGVLMTGNRIYLHDGKGVSLPLPYSDFIRHLLINGTIGVGKTEILKYIGTSLAKAGFSVVVIDLDDEWSEILNPANTKGFSDEDIMIWLHMGLKAEGLEPLIFSYASKSQKSPMDKQDFSVNFSDLSGVELKYYLPGLTCAAMDVLPGLVNEYRKGPQADYTERTHRLNTLEGFISWLRQRTKQLSHIAHEKTCEVIVRYANAVMDIFDRNASGLNPADVIKPGQISVISLADLKGSDIATKVVMLYVLRQVSKAVEKGQGSIPIEVIIDEAHQITPKVYPSELTDYQASVNHLIESTARLGRRRWMGLIFATHMPDDLSSALFNLCNTKILLQMSDPVLESILCELPILSGVRRRLISSFPNGRALIFSPALKTDLIVQFPRCTVFHRQAEKDLEDKIEEALQKKSKESGLSSSSLVAGDFSTKSRL